MNEKYLVNDFHKSKEFLLCVNSSGTAIQTMDIYHQLCYGPSFIETWGLSDNAEVVQEIWNKINLYEKTRGVNRFKALLIMLKRINDIFIKETSFESFELWINNSKNISTGDLVKEIEKNPDPLLKKALKWSQLINKKMDSIEISDKPPFKYVKESLKLASKHFDIAIISGANKERIIDEWKHHDLLKYIDVIGSQDEGSKSDCISRLIKKGYDSKNVIMIGDVIADYEAASENNVSFYPIIIDDEISSWSLFKDYYLNKILNNHFNQTQDVLIEFFKNNFTKKATFSPLTQKI